jgi:threonine dehydratase
LIAPVGGGGLISGLCIAARAIQPGIRLFAAEPAGADDAFRSKQSGRLLPQTSPDTIADGLRTSLGELTEQVLTVSESEIVAAMRWMWERAKLMIEPSSAVPVAALLGPGSAALTDARRVGVVLSGGNVDLDHLPW